MATSHRAGTVAAPSQRETGNLNRFAGYAQELSRQIAEGGGRFDVDRTSEHHVLIIIESEAGRLHGLQSFIR